MSVFVDSTTLVYPLDTNEPTKGPICEAWLNRLRHSKSLVLNPQVLNETHWTVMRKSAFAASRSSIRSYLRTYLTFCTAPASSRDGLEQAWSLQDRYGVQWWDALIMVSANAAGCTHFLSEDLNDGQNYGGVVAVNPFRHSPEDVLGRALPR